MNLITTIKNNPVASFVILTLGLSLATFLLPFPPEGAFAMIAFLLVTIPTVVAITLVAFINGRQGLSAFLSEVFKWCAVFKWAIFAFALGFLIRLGTGLIALALGRISTIEIAAPTAFFIAYFPLALLEEIGWRGFALRYLLERRSPFVATLMLAIPWSLLHYVLFQNTLPEVSPFAEMLAVIALALPLSWIYIKSRGNVLVSTVLHGALNAFGLLGINLPPAEGIWFLFASTCIVAVILVVTDKRMWFARPVKTMTVPTARVNMSMMQ